MNYYQYLRAVLFALAMAAIGALILTANLAQAEDSPGNIDAIISTLKAAKTSGAKEVVVMIVDEHDGPKTRKLRPISAVEPAPGSPDMVLILVIEGREI
jgi:hypothetical protein